MCDVQQCRREYVVADEHRHLIVIGSVHRRLATALSALVHHVVVDQRCGVQQLQTYCRMLRHLRYLSEVFSHQQYEHRPHALSRTLTDVLQRAAEHPVFM